MRIFNRLIISLVIAFGVLNTVMVSPGTERHLGLFYRGRDCLSGHYTALHLPEPACPGSVERSQRCGLRRFPGDCCMGSHRDPEIVWYWINMLKLRWLISIVLLLILLGTATPVLADAPGDQQIPQTAQETFSGIALLNYYSSSLDYVIQLIRPVALLIWQKCPSPMSRKNGYSNLRFCRQRHCLHRIYSRSLHILEPAKYLY